VCKVGSFMLADSTLVWQVFYVEGFTVAGVAHALMPL
jgi:hypothetical protein